MKLAVERRDEKHETYDMLLVLLSCRQMPNSRRHGPAFTVVIVDLCVDIQLVVTAQAVRGIE